MLRAIIVLSFYNWSRLQRYLSLIWYWDSLDLSFLFSLDRISLRGIVLVLFISIQVIVFSRKYHDEGIQFYGILIGFIISILLLLIGGSLTSMIVGWDGLGVTSFFLIIHYDNKAGLYGGWYTFLTNRIGDRLLIGGAILWLFLGRTRYTLVFFSSLLIFLILASWTKRAQFPFMFWLPLAIKAPTPVRALVHRSTLVTAGVFIIIRVLPLQQRYIIVMFIGSVTFVIGAVLARFEYDFKKLVAYTTLSNLGLIIVILGCGIVDTCIFHVVIHAFYKAGLFILIGSVLTRAFGGQDSRNKFGLSSLSPIEKVLIVILILNRIGLCFRRVYFSKHGLLLRITRCGRVSSIVIILVVTGLIYTSYYRVTVMITLVGGLSIIRLYNSSENWFTPAFVLSSVSLFLGRRYIMGRRVFIFRKPLSLLFLTVVVFIIFKIKRRRSQLLLTTFWREEASLPLVKDINYTLKSVEVTSNGVIALESYLRNISWYNKRGVLTYLIKSNSSIVIYLRLIRLSVIIIII